MPLPWRVRILILGGGPAVAMAISGITVALPKIEIALATTPEDKFLIKMLVGVVGAAMIVGSMLMGFLADRLGLFRTLCLNYVLFTIAGTSGLYLNSLSALVVARFLVGVAGAGAVTASIIIINKQIVSDERAQWMGGYIAAAGLSAILFFPLGGALAELNWRYVFAIYLFGAPLAALASISFKVSADVVAERAEYVQPLKLGLRRLPFELAALGLIIGCITYLQLIYAPFVLRDMGAGPKLVSYALLGDSVTGILTSLLFGRFRRYLSASGVFVLAFIATGVGGVVVSRAPGYIWVAIGLAVSGLGIGWLMPNLMMLVGKRAGREEQGRAAGLVKGANYMGAAVCVAATEWLSQKYGPRIPLLVSTALSLSLAAFVIYQDSRRGKFGMVANPGDVI